MANIWLWAYIIVRQLKIQKFKEIEKNTKNLVRNFVYSVKGKLLK